MKRLIAFGVAGICSTVAILLSGCHSTFPFISGECISKAVAVVQPTQGSNVRGTVTFTKGRGGIRVVADIEGLTPNAQHGFHIHEFGDATSTDGTAAGGHFNPHGKAHGAPKKDIRHAGDLGNLLADANGKAHYERVDAVISFTGRDTIIGRCVIIHEKEDDLVSQPTGAAGARIAQGVIGVAK